MASTSEAEEDGAILTNVVNGIDTDGEKAHDILLPKGHSVAITPPASRAFSRAEHVVWLTLMVFGSHVIHLITFGMSISFGVFYSALHTGYFGVSNAQAAWVASLYVGLTLGAGLPSGICVQKFGDRIVAIVGCLFLVVGLFASGFVASFWPLYVTFGVFGGLGSSLSHVAANTVLVRHFDQRRALAIALASCGVGIGNLALPPLMTYWIAEYGWRGTFIMLAAVGMQGIVAGATFRETAKGHEERSTETCKPRKHTAHATRDTLIKLAKDKQYFLFLISSTLTSLALYIPYTMLPDLLKTRNLSDYEIAVVASISGSGDIFGRIVVGVMSGIWTIDKLYLHILVVISAGLMAIMAPFIETFFIFIIYSIIYGISTGGFTGLQVVTVSEIVGKEDTPLGYGTMATCKGVASCIGIPIAGFIIDSSHQYKEGFFFAGCNFLAAGIVAMFMKLDFSKICKCLAFFSDRDINPQGTEKTELK